MTDTDTGTSALDPNPFEIIDSPWGAIERWRASTLSTGTMGALAQVYDIVRNDAAEAVARVEQMEARKALIQHLCDQIAAMQERINTLADALEARHRSDAEAAAHQAAFEKEPLSLPPGQELELEREPDSTIAADLQSAPTGELHDLPPKDEGDLPEPPLEADNIGDLPEELAERSVPPEEPPKGRVYPQPIAIGLNEE
jgi:hypothetical protein